MASKIPINQLPPGSFLTGSEQVAVVQNNTTVQVPTSYFFPGTNTAFSRYAFIATSGQTNFAVPYTPGLLSVYQNGLLLATSRYTATNSTAVVLNTGATAGDDIEIFTFLNTASVGSMYTDFSNATGINAVNHGGTGTSTSTGTGSVVLSNAPSLVSPNLGTVASGVLTGATGLPLSTGVTGTLTVSNGGTGANTLTGYLYGNGTGAVTASTTISGANITGNISGNAANVTGTVAVLNGGTGVTTSTGSGSVVLSTAPTLAGPNITSGIVLKGATSQTVTLQTQSVAGNYTLTLPSTAGSLNYALITDGSGNLSWSPGGGTVSSVNVSGGTTGLTTSGGPIVGSGTITLAGTLNVANGGTGVTSSTGTGNVVLSNAPTFTAPNLGTPNSGTLTNCSGLTLTGGAGVTGILPVPNGGTGLSTAPTNGQLLIGSTGVGYALATLTAGTNISSITNGAGSITINATGSVSSVNVSGGTTGLSFTGGPVTSSGTITASGTLTPANGGTGANTLTGYVYGNGTGTMTASTTVPVTSIGSLGTGVASALQNNIGSTGAPVTFNGALGTPSSGTLTNATGLPLTTGVTGTLPIGNGGTGSTSATGTGSVVLQTSPSLTTPSLGVATATSINGLTVSTTTGTLTLANSSTLTTVGGFSTTLTATGTTALTLPTSGTLATTANTVASFSAGTTGLTPSTASTGAVVLGGTLAVANGGTGGTTAATAMSNLGAAANSSQYLSYVNVGTSAVSRALNARINDVYSVKDFGATGNGTTDDTSAIQAALNTGKIIYFPSGTYKITSTLTMTTSYGGIIGDGISTQIAPNFTTGNIITIGDGTNEFRGFIFSQFQIWPSVVMTSGYAMQAQKVTYSVWHDVHLGGNGVYSDASNTAHLWQGIYFDRFAENIWMGGEIIGLGATAISIRGNNDQSYGAEVTIDGGLRIAACGGYGVLLGGGAGGVYLRRMDISSCGLGGVRIDNSLQASTNNREIFFDDSCTIDSCASWGIDIESNGISTLSANGLWVSGCGNSTTSAGGIRIAPSTGVSPSCKWGDIRIQNNYYDAVQLSAGIHTFTGGYVRSNGTGASGGHGILVANAAVSGLNVSGVILHNNGNSTRGYALNNSTNNDYVSATGNLFFSNGQGASTGNWLQANSSWLNNAGSEAGVTQSWVGYTPTVTSGTGTITTATATGRYRRIDRVIFIEVTINITTNGTGATSVVATLPSGITCAQNAILSGRENASTGKMLQGLVPASGTNISITNYDNTYPAANGYVIIVSGSFESVS